ncbi:hypothetical protein Agub_g6208, partial [Astrephomene gubernaculifera]
QRLQAQVLSLERQNAELQKRLADSQAALEAAQQAKQAAEAKQDALKDQAAQAASNAKAREGALETARRANDALSGELRGCQEELAAARDQLAAAKDTAVQWQDRAMELGKELEAARKKIETLGEEERRLSSENMVLRKEVQQLNDAIIKGRIEGAELREKLRAAQQDSARAVSTAHAVAYRAESEQEGAATQLAVLRNRLAELEARNSQLAYDLAASREGEVRARQAAEAARAAMAAKPAGIMSDVGPPSARQYGGYQSQNWMAPEPAPATSSSTTTTATAAGVTAPANPHSSGSVLASHSSGRPALPQPSVSASLAYPTQQQTSESSAAAVLRDLPPDIAFSKLDPETFRSMVRAEAEALARAANNGQGPSSPRQPSYGSRYGGGYGDPPLLAPEPSNNGSYVGAGPSRDSWVGKEGDHERKSYDHKPYDAGVRDSLQALLPDPRASWAAQLRDARGYGGGRGGDGVASPTSSWSQQQHQQHQQQQQQQFRRQPPGGGGNNATAPTSGPGSSSSPPPPPYAIHTVDSSYAFRRPPNAVGAGTTAPLGAAAASDTPFGTEMTTKELMSRSKALEDQLMVLCSEKGGLEAEYARMPLGAGRSLRERNRKAVVEQRLELLNKEISAVRMQLKRLG